MKTAITLSLFVLILVTGCQQASQKLAQEAGAEPNLAQQVAESMGAATQEFGAANSKSRAAASATPRVRVVVTWGGGLLSCAEWKLVQLQGSEPLYQGRTRKFEYLTDRAGRVDDNTVYSTTRTCGHKDRGAVSMDVVAGATLALTYDMKNVYGGKASQGTISLDHLVVNGGYLPTKLDGGNFINAYAEIY